MAAPLTPTLWVKAGRLGGAQGESPSLTFPIAGPMLRVESTEPKAEGLGWGGHGQ